MKEDSSSMQSRPVGIYQGLVLKHLILTNTIEGITEVKLPECMFTGKILKYYLIV